MTFILILPCLPSTALLRQRIAESFHYPRERFLELSVIGFGQAGFDVDDKIEAGGVQTLILIRPHDLPQSSLAAIANYGAADFPRHCYSDPLLANVVFQNES